MTKHQPRQFEPSDKTYAALTVANGYIHGEIDPHAAILQLKKRGTFGWLIAGEVALEESSKAEPFMISTWMEHARSLLARVALRPTEDSREVRLVNQSRASFRLAQLAVLQTMFKSGEIPPYTSTYSMYRKFAESALAMTTDIQAHEQNRSHEYVELKGSRGEVAVSLLRQRYEHSLDPLDRSVTTQSLFSQDHGGDCLNDTGAPAWDLNVFHTNNGSDVELSHRLQIKLSANYPVDYPGVRTVYIYPGLALSEKENPYLISDAIIKGCAAEHRDTENTGDTPEQLEARTEKLLSIMA